MNNSTYIAIGTLVLGWLLSEGSQYLRNRSSRLKATNKALSELLEIRHRVFASQATLNLICEKFNLGPIPRNQIRGIMPTPLKVDETLRQRFNDAVSEIANYDPFLAYRLRGKDILGSIETYFTSQEIDDERYHEISDYQLELLGKDLLPVLDEIILEVAKYLSIISWWRAKQLLSKKAEIPEEYVKILGSLNQLYLGSTNKNASARQ